MKSNIVIAIVALFILVGAVGTVFYQKASYEMKLAQTQKELFDAKTNLSAETAKVADLQAKIANNVQVPTPTVQPILPPATVVVDGINVAEQTVGSNIVTIATAAFSKPGFIVIHSETNGQVGAVIGASALLKAGTINNVPITINEKLKANTNYYAMLHFDNGDGIYTAIDEDVPVKDANGNVVMMKFIASTTTQIK